MKLHWQILIALVLAVIAGLATGVEGSLLGLRFYDVYTFIGTLFLNGLKMIIVPLVVSSIIVGIAGIGSSRAFGRLGGRTLIYYLATTFISVSIGLLVVNTLTPGIYEGQPLKDVINLTADVSAIADKVEGRGAGDLVDVFLRMVPPNVVAAAANGQMLGLIFFSLLFGFFVARVGEPHAENLYGFWAGIYEVMLQITLFIMRFAPIGVFGLVAVVMADTGASGFLDLMEVLGLFFFSVLLALALHFLVVMPLILHFVAGVNPVRHYRAMAPALLTAFSTASSSATLPLTIECVEKNAGVSNRTSSFVLPLGSTVNMDGTALYECVAAMFIAQAYGLDLSLTQQFVIVLLALLTSIGVAGVPSASLVAITIILGYIGLPLEGIALIYVVDRLLDMCRTAVNVFSDSCGAVVIGRLEGEEGILKN
ncbi:dicarboxylate/amino acid:cation symporter [Sulfuriflexus sp.]|uniref:dicarboxylate/amino acid:cation symporter n=1 Tax=Sulfuriflexus sp. TaxID=2015443 RepID=UPI0028CDA920|nr:dicarboxylate/amino acid:cation symporter [Sulfuriflexus sp.]MDT8403402.1 dicarboxylate/amino acid:cation symporter [Sulfuriflexus sp.]